MQLRPLFCMFIKQMIDLIYENKYLDMILKAFTDHHISQSRNRTEYLGLGLLYHEQCEIQMNKTEMGNKKAEFQKVKDDSLSKCDSETFQKESQAIFPFF